MKKLMPLLLLVVFGNVCAQSVEQPSDTLNYTVAMYIGKDRDSYQTLSFTKENMTFSEAERYGFKPETFKRKQKNDSTWTFVVVTKSAKNGIMTWEGTVINDLIEGTCIWTRKVENPVNYTFKGKEVKD
ncbi:MAG: hypothetical protein ABIO46_13725 [Chitinophagales bacterium]